MLQSKAPKRAFRGLAAAQIVKSMISFLNNLSVKNAIIT